jgi:hypothetical protein
VVGERIVFLLYGTLFISSMSLVVDDLFLLGKFRFIKMREHSHRGTMRFALHTPTPYQLSTINTTTTDTQYTLLLK